MPDAFTIRMFVPDGDPEGIRIIDRMNWTGIGVAFPRTKWPEARQRPELSRTGVYILVGYKDEDPDLPTIYIGQADVTRNRIESHNQEKPFWDRAIVFASTSGLNRAHVTWLEYALVKRASDTKGCHLDNGNSPQEPALTEAEKADTQSFLKEILQILPLLGIRAFEFPKAIVRQAVGNPIIPPRIPVRTPLADNDTVVVPAQKDGFERVFLDENCWYAIRIGGGMLDKIKYIAAYQTMPVSAITHYASVARIEPYGDEGKYKLVFSQKAEPIGPIPLGDAVAGTMQGPRYTSLVKLRTAKKVSDLFGGSMI